MINNLSEIYSLISVIPNPLEKINDGVSNFSQGVQSFTEGVEYMTSMKWLWAFILELCQAGLDVFLPISAVYIIFLCVSAAGESKEGGGDILPKLMYAVIIFVAIKILVKVATGKIVG